MKVATGTKTAAGRTIDVELEAADGARIWAEDWDSLSVDKQFKRLSAYADLQVLQYLLRNGEIHQDYFKERVAALAKDIK